eukprot:1404464-Pyramimonas_sp.AAC.1
MCSMPATLAQFGNRYVLLGRAAGTGSGEGGGSGGGCGIGMPSGSSPSSKHCGPSGSSPSDPSSMAGASPSLA